MTWKIHAIGLSVAVLFGAQAHATSASNIAFTGYNSTGTVDATAFTITGGANYTDTEITYQPPPVSIGPSNPYGTAGGYHATSAYNTTQINFGYLFPYYSGNPTYFWGTVQTTSGQLALEAHAVSQYSVQDTAEVGSSGTFSLAANSSVTLSGLVNAAETPHSYATLTFALDGGPVQTWDGTSALSLTLSNTTGVAETGTFSMKLFEATAGTALAVPEPGEAALLLAGLLTVGALARRRQAA